MLIKNLNKQLDQISVGSILSDKSKNILKDEKINNINVRFQKVIDLPFKDLRKLIDEGKKELKSGIVVVYAVNDTKVGLGVGITKELEKQFDAVKLVRAGSDIIGVKVVEAEVILHKLVELYLIKLMSLLKVLKN